MLKQESREEPQRKKGRFSELVADEKRKKELDELAGSTISMQLRKTSKLSYDYKGGIIAELSEEYSSVESSEEYDGLKIDPHNEDDIVDHEEDVNDLGDLQESTIKAVQPTKVVSREIELTSLASRSKVELGNRESGTEGEGEEEKVEEEENSEGEKEHTLTK